MKTKLMALVLLAGGSLFAQTRFSVGVRIGGYGPGYYAPAPVYAAAPRYYVPAPPVYAAVPAYPGPGYFWVNGYWNYYGPRRVWVNGYWSRRPYARGYYRGFRR